MTYSGRKVPQRAGKQHYETMTLDEIKALPVADVAAKDCVLLMWIVDSHVDQGLALAAHWGFTYKTLGFVWRKVKKTIDEESYEDDGASSMGMGKWTRKECEFCFLFTRGKPPRLSGGVRQIINAPRREHSRKPDEAYDSIEALAGGPYLELFARTRRPGWSAWGNQTDKFRKLPNEAEALL